MFQSLPPFILILILSAVPLGLLLWLTGRVGFCVGVSHCLKQRPELSHEARMALAAWWGVAEDDLALFTKEWAALEDVFDDVIYLDDRLTLLTSQPIRYTNNPVKRDLVDYLRGRGVSRDLTRELDSMRVGDLLESLVSQLAPNERDPGRVRCYRTEDRSHES